MKKHLLILLILCIGLVTSCKKVCEEPEVKLPQEVTLQAGENLIEMIPNNILEGHWIIVGIYGHQLKDTRVWKLKSGNNVIILNPVPHYYFWSGKFLVGKEIDSWIVLNIDRGLTVPID